MAIFSRRFKGGPFAIFRRCLGTGCLITEDLVNPLRNILRDHRRLLLHLFGLVQGQNLHNRLVIAGSLKGDDGVNRGTVVEYPVFHGLDLELATTRNLLLRLLLVPEHKKLPLVRIQSHYSGSSTERRIYSGNLRFSIHPRSSSYSRLILAVSRSSYARRVPWARWDVSTATL